MARGEPLFVAWTERDGRARELAAALGGSAWCVYPRGLRGRRLAPLRYLASAVLMVARLTRTRPAALLVTNPPMVAALVGMLWSSLAKVPMAIDSHPTGFGAKGHRTSQRLQPLHRRLARRAAAVLVTTRQWVDVVHEWGGRAVVVHEAPPAWSVPPPRTVVGRPKVLFVGIFGGDEPVAEVIAAAADLPACDIAVTGDLARSPAGVVESAPPNVRFTGYLRGDAYVDAIAGADVIIALTTEPTSVMRAAYEAVYASRPLVISDTPTLRSLFPHAVLVANQRGAIAAGVRDALARHQELCRWSAVARQLQLDRWGEQLRQLRAALDLDPPVRPLSRGMGIPSP